MRGELNKRARVNPEKKILIVFALASHGMQDSGRQVVLLNDFNAKKGFFNTWQVEHDIRDRASAYKNTYQIAIFACCREHFRETYHCGLFKGTKEEAIAHFEAIAQAEFDAHSTRGKEQELKKLVENLQEKLNIYAFVDKERLEKLGKF